MLRDTHPADLRDKLRRAIEAARISQAEQHRAAAAEARARAMLDEAQAELARFDTLDDRIIAWRASRIKVAVSTGQPTGSLDLPSNLVEERAARLGVAERVAAFIAAHASLATELAAAGERLQLAGERVDAAAVAVLVDRTDELAARLAMAQSEARRLIDELEGGSLLRVPQPRQAPVNRGPFLSSVAPTHVALPIAQSAVAALVYPAAADIAPLTRKQSLEATRARWNDWFNRLHVDAAAELELTTWQLTETFMTEKTETTLPNGTATKFPTGADAWRQGQELMRKQQRPDLDNLPNANGGYPSGPTRPADAPDPPAPASRPADPVDDRGD